MFRKYSEQNNPPVNEVRRSRVERNPIVNFTIERRDFGDDPEGRKWLDINPSTPVVKNGRLFSEGYIQGWDVYECGFEDCELCPHKVLRTAPFNEVTKDLTFNVYVYNGMKNIPSKSFRNEIENNRVDFLTKKCIGKVSRIILM